VTALVNFTEATISLALQIVALALLFIAITLKNKKSYGQHGISVTVALLLHIVTVLAVMVPTISTLFTSPGAIVYDAVAIIALIHVALGFVAVALGIWLVAVWHFKTNLKSCFANRKIMRLTMFVWTVSILLGVLMYIVFWAFSFLA
jgi:uncharacterized membrane protein YozB (DUF420 family)